MILMKYDKQPADVKDYDTDYTDWMPTGDAISTYSASVVCLTDTTETSPTLLVDSQEATSLVLKTWLSGGTSGQTYKVTVTITTTGGRTDQAEFKVKVKDT
jgi:hypothetical protein